MDRPALPHSLPLSVLQRSRLAQLCLLIAGSFIFGTVVYLAGLQLHGNFHEVIPGELYRSAQFDGATLRDYAERYHIRTVINLRGDNTGKHWYDEELAATKAVGLNHIDYRMSSSKHLDDHQIIDLIDIMRRAPKPLLIHCEGGSDRTGLATALYLAAIAKRSEFASELQLSIIYGHMPITVHSSFALNDSFEDFEPVLGFDG